MQDFLELDRTSLSALLVIQMKSHQFCQIVTHSLKFTIIDAQRYTKSTKGECQQQQQLSVIVENTLINVATVDPLNIFFSFKFGSVKNVSQSRLL